MGSVTGEDLVSQLISDWVVSRVLSSLLRSSLCMLKNGELGIISLVFFVDPESSCSLEELEVLPSTAIVLLAPGLTLRGFNIDLSVDDMCISNAVLPGVVLMPLGESAFC